MSKQVSEWRRGWRMVLASAMGCGTGIAMFNLTSGLFIQPLQNELGWSRSAVTITPIISSGIALGSLPAGYLVDRFGSRKIVLVGLSGFVLGLLALACLPTNSYTFYGSAIFIAAISSMVAFGPFSKGIAAWFQSNLGGAIGLTLGAPSLLALAVFPAVAAAIHAFGWRAGLLTLAAFTVCLGLPMVATMFRDQPPGAKLVGHVDRVEEGATVRQALRDWRYWMLFSVIFIGALPLGGFMVHLIPLLSSHSVGLAAATSLGVVYAMTAGIGRLGGGFLLDRFEPHLVASIFFTFAGLGGILLPYIPIWAIALPIVALALGAGAEGDYLAFFTKRLFGTRHYGLILGSLSMAGAFATGMGALLFSVIFDQTNSYDYACLLGGVSFLIGAAITVMMGLIQRNSRRSLRGNDGSK